jgi:hypothetical protein
MVFCWVYVFYLVENVIIRRTFILFILPRFSSFVIFRGRWHFYVDADGPA